MATVENTKSEAVFSEEALELLDCVSSDFDEVLSSLAEHFAANRAAVGQPIEITPDDIVAAVHVLTKMVKRSDLPADVQQEVDSMLERINSRQPHAD